MGIGEQRSGREPEVPQPRGSWATTPAVRKSMVANRSRDTRPEVAVRSRLHALGLRYRVAARPLPDLRRTADIVFRPARVAVFIDGCYWHRCPDHYVRSLTNVGYWTEKIANNVARDRDTNRLLADAGWLVLRFWEHERADEVAATIAAAVREQRGCHGKEG